MINLRQKALQQQSDRFIKSFRTALNSLKHEASAQTSFSTYKTLEQIAMRLQRGRKWSEMLQRRERNQKRLSTDDRGAWYLPTMELLSTEATDKFHLSVLDSSTQQFLDDSQAASAAFCLQVRKVFFCSQFHFR